MPELSLCNPTAASTIPYYFDQQPTVEGDKPEDSLWILQKYKQSTKEVDPFVYSVDISYEDVFVTSLDRPFDQIFDSVQKKINVLIDKISELPQNYTQRLHRRMELLNNASIEEYPHEELLSSESIAGFLRFMRYNSQFRYPDTSITPDGNLRIQWQRDNNHHLAIEFVSETEAKFVVFSPDPQYSVKISRVAGIVTIDNILNFLAPYNITEWATENEGR